jgi:hypothetical protein
MEGLTLDEVQGFPRLLSAFKPSFNPRNVGSIEEIAVNLEIYADPELPVLARSKVFNF